MLAVLTGMLSGWLQPAGHYSVIAYGRHGTLRIGLDLHSTDAAQACSATERSVPVYDSEQLRTSSGCGMPVCHTTGDRIELHTAFTNARRDHQTDWYLRVCILFQAQPASAHSSISLAVPGSWIDSTGQPALLMVPHTRLRARPLTGTALRRDEPSSGQNPSTALQHATPPGAFDPVQLGMHDRLPAPTAQDPRLQQPPGPIRQASIWQRLAGPIAALVCLIVLNAVIIGLALGINHRMASIGQPRGEDPDP